MSLSNVTSNNLLSHSISFSKEDDEALRESYNQHDFGAFRGLMYVMVFNIAVLGCSAAVWLLLR